MSTAKVNGSRAYLFSIVLVAVIGGLLFGYDTAVISGAERGLQAFFMGQETLPIPVSCMESPRRAHCSDV